MIETKALSASMEDYLETIFHIVVEKQAARAKDIAKRLDVNNSSVTGALRSLSEKGFINYAPYDLITMTEKGKKHAEDIVRRHEALRDFFVKILCIEETEAEDTACKMEHSISRTVLDRLIQFVEFVDLCPRGGEEWLKSFWKGCKQGVPYERCEECISLRLEDLKQKKKDLGEKPAKAVLLKKLNPGQKGKILKIKGRGPMTKRLEEMKVTSGTLIKVERVDSLRDLIDVKVKGYHLSISRDEAAKISVMPV
ncbi:MAG: metal-dependent transcriptional regulator [Deltaproteobacteria bacterium]|nr:metal-dependent transcriptional regulator [Deltaproteobacteria bacterium]